MIRYFNGRIKLNETEKKEIRELYNMGGRTIHVKLNQYNDVEVSVYAHKRDGEDWEIAELFGNTAVALFHIAGITDNPKYMWSLEDIIDKYCY